MSLKQAGLRGTLCVLDAIPMRASAQVAQALEISPRRLVLRVQTNGVAGRLVRHVSERFLRPPRFAGLTQCVRTCGSITQGLAELGVADYLPRESHISAVLPGEHIAVLLPQAVRCPTLRVESVNEDLEHRPNEYAVAYFAGERVRLRVRAGE